MSFHNQSRQLVEFALEALPPMYRRERRLFCFKMVERGGKLEPVDVSIRYTAMTSIGLAEAGARGFTVPLSLSELIDGLQPHADQPLPIGDLGLILWATAKSDPSRAKALLPSVQSRWINENQTERPEQLAMYLEWLLCGLCEFVNQHPRHGDAEKLLHSIYNALLEWHYNNDTNLFYYQPRYRPEYRRPFMHKACYFAEQVYGIHALDRYARLTGNERAAEFARRTAAKLCEHQSANGGWAWLYDVQSGEVIDPYPVYSVHQTGMGPMAMLPLTGPAGDPLTTAIQSGVQWVFGVNELSHPMLDHHHGVIWRSIKAHYLPRQRHLLHKGLSAAHLSALSRKKLLQPSSFRVDRECRPYELGWLLYALSETSADRIRSDVRQCYGDSPSPCG